METDDQTEDPRVGSLYEVTRWKFRTLLYKSTKCDPNLRTSPAISNTTTKKSSTVSQHYKIGKRSDLLLN
jgi:hypothetical protein